MLNSQVVVCIKEQYFFFSLSIFKNQVDVFFTHQIVRFCALKTLYKVILCLHCRTGVMYLTSYSHLHFRKDIFNSYTAGLFHGSNGHNFFRES